MLCLRSAAEGRRLVLEEPEGRDRGVVPRQAVRRALRGDGGEPREEAAPDGAERGVPRAGRELPPRGVCALAGVDELRYTGRYQIEKSAEDARELTVTLTGSVDAEPMDRVELSLARLGVRGTFRVSETLHTLSASGETTELTLWEV